MLKSSVKFIGNKPFIEINGIPHSPLAYTTYFDECGEWSDFIKSGYRMFFVNISFNDLPINNITGFSPFIKGVFETDIPDYSDFDEIVKGIISECPGALIFPRIHISMPRKWVNENIYEAVETINGGSRESLFSEKFRHDGSELLKVLLAHIRSADYSKRIAGYQLCGGTTQEWIHHDLYGSYSEMGMKMFSKWCHEKHGIQNIKIPEKEDFNKGVLTKETQKYYEFCNEEITRTINHFARVTKEAISNEQIVGVFYGYNAFVCDCLWGLHGLGHIIDSPYIDFFSSPCCYDCNRALGFDWGDMIPADSLKLHNKLYFVECDIRTKLTRRMQDSRPGKYPENIYLQYDENGNKTAWCGPDTLELSISAIRKAFAHQVTKSSGIWWFDMWGGWYHNEEIMNELQNLRKIYNSTLSDKTGNTLSTEVALFVDENAYRNIPRGNGLLNLVNHYRVKMGTSGIPFDIYMVEDAKSVISKYKAAIFPAPKPSAAGRKAIQICKMLDIPFISAEDDNAFLTTDEIRNKLISLGVHCYNNDGCVVYSGNGLLGVHTATDGETKITLPQKMSIEALCGIELDQIEADSLTLKLPIHSTVIFKIN